MNRISNLLVSAVLTIFVSSLLSGCINRSAAESEVKGLVRVDCSEFFTTGLTQKLTKESEPIKNDGDDAEAFLNSKEPPVSRNYFAHISGISSSRLGETLDKGLVYDMTDCKLSATLNTATWLTFYMNPRTPNSGTHGRIYRPIGNDVIGLKKQISDYFEAAQ